MLHDSHRCRSLINNHPSEFFDNFLFCNRQAINIMNVPRRILHLLFRSANPSTVITQTSVERAKRTCFFTNISPTNDASWLRAAYLLLGCYHPNQVLAQLIAAHINELSDSIQNGCRLVYWFGKLIGWRCDDDIERCFLWGNKIVEFFACDVKFILRFIK